MTSVLSSGNVLTQSHVILYFTEESGDLSVYMLAIDEVTAVDLEEKGSPIKDSVYIVRTSDPDRWIKLFLSTEQKGDEKFVAALRKRIG